MAKGGRGFPLRIGLKLARGAPIESFRRVWRIADDAGFDHCWAFDHLVAADENGPNVELFEGWTLLAAMAQATTRTRIGLLVTGMVYRHPALLAKQAVTVDHLSDGRLEFGIGAGWAAVEDRMFSIGHQDHPVGRLDEGLQVIKGLWTQDRTNFAGRYFHLADAVSIPKPVQRPRPPIWIGADGPSMMRLTAQHADVWNPAGDGIEAARAASVRLVAACGDIGRDPGEIRWSAQLTFDGHDQDALLSEIRLWHAAGFSEMVVTCSAPEPVSAAEVAAESLSTLRKG